MDERLLSLLCDPVTHESLELSFETDAKGRRFEVLLNRRSGSKFPIRDGIPLFVESSQVSGLNAKYQKFYDRIAPGYDLAIRLYALLKGQRRLEHRRGYLEELEVRDGAKVLEVSIGTGANIPFFPPTVEFYGLDISWGMLKKCQRNLARWKREAHLFFGAAEYLPFRDEAFGVVFHVGGINFFSDRARAIREMIRVAKPGTKIVISDETEKHVKQSYEKMPLTGKYFQDRKEVVSAPVSLVPQDMRDVKVKEFFEGRLYCLTFRKPS